MTSSDIIDKPRTQNDIRKSKKSDKLPRILLSPYTFLEKLLHPHNVSSPKRSHFPKFGRKAATEVNSAGAGWTAYCIPSAESANMGIMPHTPQHKRYGWSWKLGLYEIRHWHLCVYGSKNEAHQLNPRQLGRAAAYEAFRTFIHTEPALQASGNVEKIQDILTGVSVSEALRLLQKSKNPMNSQTQCEATDAAVHAVAFLVNVPRGKRQHVRAQALIQTGQHNTEAFNILDILYAADDEILHKPLSLSSASSDSGKAVARASIPTSQESELILDISRAQSDTVPPETTPRPNSVPRLIITSSPRPGHSSEPISAYRRFILESARINARRVNSAPTALSVIEMFTGTSECTSDSEERISYATSRTVSTDYGNGMFYVRRAISMVWSRDSHRSLTYTY